MRILLATFGLVFLLNSSVKAAPGIDSYRLYLAQRGELPWQSLSPEEQKALKRYRRQWDGYSTERQRDMQRGARRYLALPPQKRREVERQQREYRDMSPEERRRLREKYQREHR